MNSRILALTTALALTVGGLSACSSESNTDAQPSTDGPIHVTGSATVEPITAFIAERSQQDVRITADGSTDGFADFCDGTSDINDSSVPIPEEFQKQCSDNGVEFIELPIALDAVTIVKNAENTWADDLTVEQLHDVWSQDSPVTTWSDIDPSWPDEEISLYGRPDGSGTLEVFKDKVLGGDTIREDYEATDDIDELSTWIAEDTNAIGFMGTGNYLATEGAVRDRIDNVTVDGVAPARDATQEGEYPLARPLFVYVNAESVEDNAALEEFINSYLNRVEGVLPRVYFYQLPEDEYDTARTRFNDRVTGPDSRWAA
ncbi:substrate-binding domain-containing protein [Corynebacterium sp. HMSC071B10]|uniref:substrate-binding domain-containing protein n=1 Tax=Corynebacterium sp. HMSC071B10 TaxID=1739494 RepID=UPI0008A556B4|nr:substrate-binding domain-containing protein [Corynebacterium sp. HMSC071B10]OFP35549.1 hypothetical protein HMPREF2990_08300 [Corynebacterium sp. HMSC071B10]